MRDGYRLSDACQKPKSSIQQTCPMLLCNNDLQRGYDVSLSHLLVVDRCCRGALLETASQDPVATWVPTYNNKDKR